MHSAAYSNPTEPPVYRGISAYWRRNTSTVESVELANLLGAMRKITGHLGCNIGTVSYAGLAGGGDSDIVIDPAEVMGRYPVPAAQVDQVAGIVIHEALHQVAWSEHMWCCLKQHDLRQANIPRLHRLVETAEDIYVENTIRGNLELYLAAARDKRFFVPSVSRPSVDALMKLWWTVTWSKDGQKVDDIYKAPLEILKELTEHLKDVALSVRGITQRCEQRAQLYRATWEKISPMLDELILLNKRLAWFPTSEARAAAYAKAPPKGATPLEPELKRAIEIQLAASSTDITALIAEAAGTKDVVPTSRWDFNIPAHPVIDRSLVGRLKMLFLGYSEREKITSRGLTAGRIDARRLYRAASTGQCFKATESRPAMDWNVTLLADASGSMTGIKWRMVENTVAAIHKALVGYRNHFLAYGYFEMDGVLMVSNLIKGDKLLSLPPNGRTASGQAIIAAALSMPQDKRRKLLIHVTDGESNLGLPVQAGIDFCHREHITLITLGCGCKDLSVMRDQYGNTIQFIQSFQQLPHAVEKLLRWSFMKASRLLGSKSARGNILLKDESCDAPE
ncbi:MAG: hypothetical protein QMD11_00055 [Smithella sp.]|nr:hypothetical protein [Smithella sp.]